MSKLVGFAAVMATLFPKSNQPLSEKLSTEEYNALAGEAAALQAAIEQLEAANLKVTEAEQQLAAANLKVAATEKQVNDLEGQVTSLSGERDKYKAHYDKAAAAGKTEGNADANSLNPELASYNQHALEVFHELRGK
ncbi:hypothetical protein [Salmonirosea aquatica]|uniref:Uncharacterized protein n=1 Tax=Salmonirosea aquatica TaxID=2654236 RepID=A0A7C9BFN1_9BACT|nr:hypothetical protein [Cytophagaceae bacterium SJW1-29]